MIPHSLTAENYFSAENNMKYMSCSQFKSFCSCEASALAELHGEYTREVTESLLIGSFVDAHFEGTLDIFKEQHPQIYTKNKDLKSQYRSAEYMIQRAERDELFMKYMSGEKQVIMVGKIAGSDFKIKIDSYHESNCIVDLKCVKDFESIWNPVKGIKQHFIDFWGYTIQGAIYREIVRQNTGKTLPFYIAAITKEKEPDMKIYWIPDEVLDENLQEVQSLVPRFKAIKDGKLLPQRCEHCRYCKFTQILTEPVNYLDECEVYEVE